MELNQIGPFQQTVAFRWHGDDFRIGHRITRPHHQTMVQIGFFGPVVHERRANKRNFVALERWKDQGHRFVDNVDFLFTCQLAVQQHIDRGLVRRCFGVDRCRTVVFAHVTVAFADATAESAHHLSMVRPFVVVVVIVVRFHQRFRVIRDFVKERGDFQ